VAQRLVRKICTRCKQPYAVSGRVAKYIQKAGIKPEELFHGAGCDYCRGSGFVGRVGIFELLVVDDKFRNMINEDVSVANMRKVFRESGQPAMFDDGMRKVKEGLTTIEEVLRVTEVYGQSEDEEFVENIG
jgi:type II secretory ATPase GspE/PulE/Tfp pilus assembly ATPase PilB-like protein